METVVRPVINKKKQTRNSIKEPSLPVNIFFINWILFMMPLYHMNFIFATKWMIFTINNFCLRFSQWIFLYVSAYNYIYKSGCKCMLEKEKVANPLCLWHFKRIVRKSVFHFIRHLRLFILHFKFLKIFLFSF